MTINPNLNLEDFNYELPKEKIAKFPLENRDDSKLLIVEKKNEKIKHDIFKNIDNYLSNNTLIYLNKTKVIAARIIMKKITGGVVEILILNPILPSKDPQVVMNSKNSCQWECIIGGKRLKIGSELFLKRDLGFTFKAEIVQKKEQNAIVNFFWDKKFSFVEILNKIGKVPLPPYIKRESEEIDKVRYQTVYAQIDGSVAAPTAGLHFTENKIIHLKNKGVKFDEIILHVGLGTFQPIKSDIKNHEMHSEKIIFTKENIKNLIYALQNNLSIIATGTTSLRTLESLYWLAVKSIYDNKINTKLDQFDWYKYKEIEINDALNTFLEMMSAKGIERIYAETKLFIVPDYQFKLVNGLITNFHMPKSTLMLLVAAFLGKELCLKVYNEALTKNYRFLSYGDTSLLFR